MIGDTSISMSYFNKLLLKSLTLLLSDKTNMFISIGLEITTLKTVVKDNQYFVNIFGSNDFNPPAFYSYINKTIYINYQHNIFKEYKANEMMLKSLILFVLFHEANHSLLFHNKRMNQRDHIIWNIACDYEIHNILYIFNDVFYGDDYLKIIINSIKQIVCDQHKFLFNESYLKYTAEEIYNDLIKGSVLEKTENNIYFDPQTDEFSNQFGSNKCKCKINNIKYKLPSGQTIEQTFVEFSNEDDIPKSFKRSDQQIKNDEDNLNLKRILMENGLKESLQQNGKGDISSKYNELLKKLFKIKINWMNILKNSLLNVLEKSNSFTWAKPRMISLTLPGINYLPDIEVDNNSVGNIIISRDESGSMSDDQLQRVSNIIKDAKYYYKKIIVIKHDTEITSIKEFDQYSDELEQYILIRKSRGGTSHKQVFEYIKKMFNNQENQISCYIGITDLESDIENYQNIIPANLPIFWLCPEQCYYSNKHKIKGQIIPIEES